MDYLYYDASDPVNPFKFRICKSLIDQVWGTNGSLYDDCGLNYPFPCFYQTGNTTYNYRFGCGSDIMVPSTWSGGNVSVFMNGNADGVWFKPPGTFPFSTHTYTLPDSHSPMLPYSHAPFLISLSLSLSPCFRNGPFVLCGCG